MTISMRCWPRSNGDSDPPTSKHCKPNVDSDNENSPRVYHDCPQCGDRMSRRAFAPQSGIIVNLCVAHGLITSNADLLLAMNFIQRGGEMLTIAHQVEELEQQLTEASHQEREHERSRARGGMPVIIPFLM